MKTKIAQGYNPDRVTVEELGEGYRLVPRRYLDRSKYDLTDVAQAWDGDDWDSNLDWADEDDSHRTLLSNAQLGMMTAARKKPTAVDVEANLVAPNVVRWRQLSEDERQIILKNPDRVDVDKFRHLGGRMLGLFGCPADHYATTMSREEILDLEWRDLTDAERKALRALHGTPRSLRDSRRFRHNATSSGDWHFGDCVFYPNEPDGTLRYQTDLTPAELATLLAKRAKLVDWRKVTEDERTKLELWASRPGFDPRAVDRTKFRVNGSDVHTGLTFAYKSFDYTTTLTPDELAKLVVGFEPAVTWREITEDELVKLRSAREADHTTFAASVDWGKFKLNRVIVTRSLNFTAETPGVYTTTLTPAEVEALVAKFVVWRPITEVELVILRANKDRVDWSKFRYDGLNIGKMNFDDPVRNYTTTMTPAEIEALAWRPITEAERLKLKTADKSKFDWTKFRYEGALCEGLGFTDPVSNYTTTLTPDELAKLVEQPEVWRPLSLAEVRLLQHVAQASRRAATLTPYDWRRFRCKFLSNPYHQFRVWDFGSSATDYQTTYTEQEIACRM